MIRYLILTLLILCYSSCKEVKSNPTNKVKTNEVTNQLVSYQKTTTSILDSLVRSSDYYFPTNKNTIKTRIDNIEDNIALVKLYLESNETSALGWVKINFNTNSIFNVTNDLNNPITLNYNKDIYQRYKYLLVKKGLITQTKEVKKTLIKSDNLVFDQKYKNLLNTNLVGLSVINKEQENIYKKYGIDFSTACFCDAPSIYIDEKDKKIFVYNYCESEKSLINIEHSHIFKISEIEHNNRDIIVTTEPYLKIIIKETSSTDIYKFEIEGNFPNDFIGNQLKTFFTPQPNKFIQCDCGDYES